MKTLLLLIFISISLIAQPKTINYSNWLFGFKAGITFNTSNNEAIEIYDNIYALNTSEEISTVSDDNGKLILSCNGIHLVHFIKGNSGLNYKIFDITKFKQFESSTNSNIILPSLENKNQYYIFIDYINSKIEYISCDQIFRQIDLITMTDFEAVLNIRNLSINLSTEEQGIFKFIVIDINGNIVKQQDYTTSKNEYNFEEIFQLDLSNLASGIYNIRMTSPSGKYYTKRIILVD